MNIEKLVKIEDSDEVLDKVVGVKNVPDKVRDQADSLILDYMGYEDGDDESDVFLQFYEDKAGGIKYFKSSSKEKLTDLPLILWRQEGN